MEGSPANNVAPEEAAKVRGFYEWRLANGRCDATLGREGMVALGAFVRATRVEGALWIELGTGTPEYAAEEAELVAHHLGDRLLAFQVGNEADLYGSAFR
jgi:hypothetical protein